MKANRPARRNKRQAQRDHALLVEWGGLIAGAYGRPAVFALLLIVFGFIAFKFV